MDSSLRFSPPTTRLVLDRDYTLLEASGQYEEWNRQFIGTYLFDAYPDAVPVLKPVYEEARRAGHCYRVVPYRGLALQVHAHHDRSSDTLTVHATSLPLDGLRETIEALLAEQDDHDAPQECCEVIALPVRR